MHAKASLFGQWCYFQEWWPDDFVLHCPLYWYIFISDWNVLWQNSYTFLWYILWWIIVDEEILVVLAVDVFKIILATFVFSDIELFLVILWYWTYYNTVHYPMNSFIIELNPYICYMLMFIHWQCIRGGQSFTYNLPTQTKQCSTIYFNLPRHWLRIWVAAFLGSCNY